MSKKLLIFNLAHGPNTNELSEQSNSWYLKGYEAYFDDVCHLSLNGPKREIVSNGNSRFEFVTGDQGLLAVFLSPFRLYRFIKKHKPTHAVTYEQIWLWWTISLVRLFTDTPVYLLPITFPEQMYKITGKGLSNKLPIWFERILLRWSYRSCFKVVSSYNVGNYINWLNENKIIGRKLIISNSLPESVVFPAFMKRLGEIEPAAMEKRRKDGEIKLIYVGRLHAEKMTDHLVKAFVLVKASVPAVRLTIIGQGPEKETLVAMAQEAGVADDIKFQDYVNHSELPDYLLSSDIFISTATGHAFREAAMCGLPIVAYNIDWVKGFLIHGQDFYGVDKIDFNDFAKGIITLCKDEELRHTIAVNSKKFADKYWSAKQLKSSLTGIFEPATEL